MEDSIQKHMKIGRVLTNFGIVVYNLTDFILLKAHMKFIEDKKVETSSPILQGPLFLNPWRTKKQNA